MPTIDSQVHLWERNHAGRPWIVTDRERPPEVTAETMIAMMDAESVDAAVVVSPWLIYGYEAGYALEVAARYPSRFSAVAPVDSLRPDVADFVADWAAIPHTAGLRLMLASEESATWVSSGLADPFLRAAQSNGVPVCVAGAHRFGEVADAAGRYPELQLVIDHLGLPSPVNPPYDRAAPFADLPGLTRLANFANVAVKVSAVPALSSQPFPYPDIFPPIVEVCAAFGVERCMWGTDWTRTQPISFGEALKSFRETNALSADELDQLMGGTASRIFGMGSINEQVKGRPTR